MIPGVVCSNKTDVFSGPKHLSWLYPGSGHDIRCTNRTFSLSNQFKHCLYYTYNFTNVHTYMSLEILGKYPHLLFSSSILSVGTIMFPYSSRFWKDWKVFRCCGISSRQTYSNIQQWAHSHAFKYPLIKVYILILYRGDKCIHIIPKTNVFQEVTYMPVCVGFLYCVCHLNSELTNEYSE